MPLKLVRSRSNAALWSACAERFLDGIGAHTGPDGYASFAWIAHRNQRDALFALAAQRGLPGWLAPPISFLSELPVLFGISGRPISNMTRRFLVARIGSAAARSVGFGAAAPGWPGTADRQPAAAAQAPLALSGDATLASRQPQVLNRAPMLDGLFGELLPEGVTPASLRSALAAAPGDSFTRHRDEWIVAAYGMYLGELAERGLYDPRAIHALVARRIEDGALPEALRGARTLHIYGVYTPHVRRHLLRALRAQKAVEVRLYVPHEDEPGEWEGLDAPSEEVAAGRIAPPVVQPAPDALQEARWIAGQVKTLLAEGDVEPHEVAVVARTGRDDTRRLQRVFAAAGIPGTARVRTPLAEVPALRAILELLRGAALDWPYRPLRHALASPYLRVGIDLRAVDRVAAKRRPGGLEEWDKALERILDVELDSEEGRRLRREGIRRERVERDLEAFRAFADAVRPLARPRSEAAWIEATLALLAGDRFDLRRRLCRPAGDRWDIVRLDQRGVRNLEQLLREWREFADAATELDAGEWHGRLRRLVESSEIALSTPLQKGVQILEAHEAALTPFRKTFIVHANDGVFPRRRPTIGILSEEERELLSRQAGLPLTHAEDHQRRERTLWRAVAGSPNVTVTYRTTDTSGTPRLPSLMVPEHDPADELPRSFGVHAEPLNRAQARRRAAFAFAAARRRRMGESVPTPDQTDLRRAIVAAYAEIRRVGRLPSVESAPLSAHPWHGELRDPRVLEILARRYGEDHLWSAGQLQLYSGCPFLFLVERVLRLDEVGEIEEETSPRVFGSVAHDALERFYRHYTERPPPPELSGEALELCEEAVDEALRAAETEEDWIGLPALWATTRHALREAVVGYVRWELGVLRRHGEHPHRVEYSFGFGESAPVEIRGRDLGGRPRRLRLCGRVDRIDVVRAGDLARYHVLDYKSGSYPGRRQYEDGSLLQIPLYMEVLAEAESLDVRSGYFRSVRKHGTQHGSTVEHGDPRYKTALATAFTIPARVRQGLFEPVKSAHTAWQFYEPGLDVRRTNARLPRGRTRFDDVVPRDGGFGRTEESDA